MPECMGVVCRVHWLTCVAADRIRSLEQLSRREDMLAEMHNPASMAPFTLITGRPFIFGTPWSYLYEFLTTDIVSLQHLHR